MEKDQKVLIGLIVFILLVTIGIGTYLIINRNNNVSDAVKFKREYESLNKKKEEETQEKYLNITVDSDNVFVYKSDEEILDVLNKETGIVYFGYATCPYCRSMVNLLNDLAKESNLDTIYYVDIENISDNYEVMEKTVSKITNGTDSYYKILDKLSDYLTDYYIEDSDGLEYNTGVKRLYAPTVVAVKDGEIVGFHEGTTADASYNRELTPEEQTELKIIYKYMINKLNSDVCTEDSCKN